jgi:CHRD domain
MSRTIVLVLASALALLGLTSTASAGENFVALLSGDQEVPAWDTPATGVAKFKLREDGTALLFKINVEDITNVVAAHIHCGAPGVNGPVGCHSVRGVAGRRPGEWHPGRGNDHRPRRGQRVRLDRPGLGAGRAREWQHLRQRSHQRRRPAGQYRSRRLPRWRDPRPSPLADSIERLDREEGPNGPSSLSNAQPLDWPGRAARTQCDGSAASATLSSSAPG